MVTDVADAMKASKLTHILEKVFAMLFTVGTSTYYIKGLKKFDRT